MSVAGDKVYVGAEYVSPVTECCEPSTSSGGVNYYVMAVTVSGKGA